MSRGYEPGEEVSKIILRANNYLKFDRTELLLSLPNFEITNIYEDLIRKERYKFSKT